MQQFTVPQFIDTEDKIIGALSVRQFCISLAGFLLIVIFYKIFDFSLFLFLSALTVVVFGTFAFIKINGMPFHFFVLNVIQTLRRPMLRVWNNNESFDESFNEVVHLEKKVEIIKKEYSASRLNQLSLIVDTKGAYDDSGESDDVLILEDLSNDK